MEKRNLTQLIKNCGDLFYQNREQEAYQTINRLLADVNQTLQNMVVKAEVLSGEEGEELGQYIFQVMEEFLDAYQVKDNLALADLLYYNISELIEMSQEA